MSWYVGQDGRQVWIPKDESVYTVICPAEKLPMETLAYLTVSSKKAATQEYICGEEESSRGATSKRQRDKTAGRQRGFILSVKQEDNPLSRIMPVFKAAADNVRKSPHVVRLDADEACNSKLKKKKNKDKDKENAPAPEKDRLLGVNEVRVETTARIQHFAHGTGFRVEVAEGSIYQRLHFFTGKTQVSAKEWHEALVDAVEEAGGHVMLARRIRSDAEAGNEAFPALEADNVILADGLKNKCKAQEDEDDWYKSMLRGNDEDSDEEDEEDDAEGEAEKEAPRSAARQQEKQRKPAAPSQRVGQQQQQAAPEWRKEAAHQQRQAQAPSHSQGQSRTWKPPASQQKPNGTQKPPPKAYSPPFIPKPTIGIAQVARPAPAPAAAPYPGASAGKGAAPMLSRSAGVAQGAAILSELQAGREPPVRGLNPRYDPPSGSPPPPAQVEPRQAPRHSAERWEEEEAASRRRRAPAQPPRSSEAASWDESGAWWEEGWHASTSSAGPSQRSRRSAGQDHGSHHEAQGASYYSGASRRRSDGWEAEATWQNGAGWEEGWWEQGGGSSSQHQPPAGASWEVHESLRGLRSDTGRGDTDRRERKKATPEEPLGPECGECGKGKIKLFVDQDDNTWYCGKCWLAYYGKEAPNK
eukprot:TRINITY_DN1432_c0_g2_i2.p1 TRINITY_DN1432_c0_g2~~TRINITY_DN1432_c0_g2_i2.p1  ORF type:complete len:641 (-),score=161.14 TRINITY_DN1432_c0_g2_i2:183-2105(-)